MRQVAVFDTNILFSAMGWQGKPFQCVELARSGVVEGVTCREILDELAEKLQTKLAFSAQQALDAVADLLDSSREIPKSWGTTKFPESFLIDKDGNIRYYIVSNRDWDAPSVQSCIDALMD